MLQQLKQKIKRRETPFDAWLFETLVSLRSLSLPVIPGVHAALYRERQLRRALWGRLTKGLYYEPLFKSRCTSVGRRFRIENGGGDGIPTLSGDLEMYIGHDVRMMDRITISGVGEAPPGRLYIGDRTYLGLQMLISVGREIHIGKQCLIGAYLITDNPGHPIGDLGRRLSADLVRASECRPVHIGDYVWLATGTHVYPGCRIGDGVVALPGTHVAGMDVPPFTLVSGNPGRIQAKLPLPSSLIEIVGQERYQAYREAHRNLKL
ncbi:MAG: acyltransferase [Bryobacterales bacterium]|nr:acyltransferase [Acidobacteriota bacterium]MCB9385064.1 acyltransferase [Bryobacterales bacterium]